MGRTMGDVWRDAVTAGRAYPAYLVERADGWAEVGWEEAGARVDELAAGFLAAGVGPGDTVSILGRTRVEWALCDFAAASIGAVTAPIYQTNSREECAHVLADSGARLLVCEDSEQVEKTRGLPGPAEVVAMDPVPGVRSLAELADAGRSVGSERLAAAREAAGSEDVLTLIYTSGTTGPAKGCAITHANFVAEIEAVRQVAGLFAERDVVLLFLPLAHNFARLVTFSAAALGLTVAFLPEPTDVTRALGEVRPTTFPSVPRIYEKMHARVEASFAEATGVKRRLIDRSLAVGREAAARRERGEALPAALRLQHRVADRLVFSKLKERLGGRMRVALSGGGPLAREIVEFFAACGIVILEGYGLSETTSGCTVNRPDAYRFGTVGLPLPGVELRLADDGEVLVRGPTVFRGYHGRPEDTAAAVDPDGWLRTGDVGEVDADGFLAITDRKKELIVTAGGKKIAPQNLENALKASPLVADAVVVGERRPYVVALLTLDPDELSGTGEREARSAVEDVVTAVNAPLGRTEQIKRFAILPRPFAVEDGELTPTLKVRRRVIEERYREQIDALYAAPGER
ncbi:MAG: long-chain fatty acid--CoA ligase [Thermoleophilia bacterium]|nr:long-chain fatty acid--CoA ligase [Thermoleophilia bacterium]